MGIQYNMEEFKALKDNEISGRVTMLNLLKFKEDGGLEMFKQYLKEAGKYVQGVGGRVVYLGKPEELLNGSESWDLIMMVEYPSRRAFLDMVNDPAYQEVHRYREKALERAVLYAVDPLDVIGFLEE